MLQINAFSGFAAVALLGWVQTQAYGLANFTYIMQLCFSFCKN